MSPRKLFHVLVAGGAALAFAGACTSSSNEPDAVVQQQRGDAPATEDAFHTGDAAAGAVTDAAALTSCFCETDPCCDREAPGGPVLTDGFVCCWAAC